MTTIVYSVMVGAACGLYFRWSVALCLLAAFAVAKEALYVVDHLYHVFGRYRFYRFDAVTSASYVARNFVAELMALAIAKAVTRRV